MGKKATKPKSDPDDSFDPFGFDDDDDEDEPITPLVLKKKPTAAALAESTVPKLVAPPSKSELSTQSKKKSHANTMMPPPPPRKASNQAGSQQRGPKISTTHTGGINSSALSAKSDAQSTKRPSTQAILSFCYLLQCIEHRYIVLSKGSK